MVLLENVECQPFLRTLGRYHLVLKNQIVVNIVEGDKTPPRDIKKRIDASSVMLVPRGVDVQTHLRVPGQTQKETPETGLSAAFHGGYSAVLTMPNTKPVIDNCSVLREADILIKPFAHKYDVRVYFSAAITLGQQGQVLAPLADLAMSGAKAFTDDGRGVMSDALMRQAFEIAAEVGRPLLQHAEVEGHGGVLAPGPVQKQLRVPPYPDTAEIQMVERDLRILKTVPKARYHVLHVSSARTVESIRTAQSQGLKVTGEVSPHHLHFNCTDIQPQNSSYKMNPPLRFKEDQKILRAALAEGILDFVATDHAPHEAAVKSTDFVAAANGTLGLETTLAVLVQMYQQQECTLNRLIEVWSKKPAQFLGLEEIDVLKEGLPLHGVFIDLQSRPQMWSADDFHSLSKNSCFIGTKLPKPIVAIANAHGVHAQRADHPLNDI